MRGTETALDVPHAVTSLKWMTSFGCDGLRRCRAGIAAQLEIGGAGGLTDHNNECNSGLELNGATR